MNSCLVGELPQRAFVFEKFSFARSTDIVSDSLDLRAFAEMSPSTISTQRVWSSSDGISRHRRF